MEHWQEGSLLFVHTKTNRSNPTLLHFKLRSICAQSVTKNHPILAMPVRVMAVDLLFVAIKTTHGSLPVLKSVNLHTVVRLPFNGSHQSSHASQCLKIGLTKWFTLRKHRKRQSDRAMPIFSPIRAKHKRSQYSTLVSPLRGRVICTFSA